jgi:hypothetical protein
MSSKEIMGDAVRLHFRDVVKLFSFFYNLVCSPDAGKIHLFPRVILGKCSCLTLYSPVMPCFNLLVFKGDDRIRAQSLIQ